MVYDQSASFDVQVLEMGNEADAWPAFGFHLVEVFQACKVSSSIGSSGFSSLLADWIGSSNIVHTGNLESLGALLGSSKASQEGKQGKD